MLVKDVMTTQPHYLRPNETIKRAALEMQKLDCGVIPVGDGKRLLGMVTDRDIAIRAVARGKDPDNTQLKEIMSPNVWYCYEDDDVKKAAQSMENKQVKRLIVLNHDKKLTGIIALGDIANKTHDEKLCGEIVESISSTEKH